MLEEPAAEQDCVEHRQFADAGYQASTTMQVERRMVIVGIDTAKVLMRAGWRAIARPGSCCCSRVTGDRQGVSRQGSGACAVSRCRFARAGGGREHWYPRDARPRHLRRGKSFLPRLGFDRVTSRTDAAHGNHGRPETGVARVGRRRLCWGWSKASNGARATCAATTDLISVLMKFACRERPGVGVTAAG